ncbi:MAG: 5'/3'-nucleotidase SurE [Candidatus Baldrarchaeia archaeon]
MILTNDDGIRSPGLLALYKELIKIVDVLVVAPESQKSGAGKSLTFHKPIRVCEFTLEKNFKGYAVSGTPADAILFGLSELCSKPPDLVISGINIGLNIGMQSILTSGTLGGVLEAAIYGIPSIAFSFEMNMSQWFAVPETLSQEQFKTVSKRAKEIVSEIIEKGMPEGVDLLNVNFPSNTDKNTPIKITRPCRSRYVNRYEQRVDPFGIPYYWIYGTENDSTDPETDLYAIKVERAISITPISLQLTSKDLMKKTQVHFNFK